MLTFPISAALLVSRENGKTPVLPVHNKCMPQAHLCMLPTLRMETAKRNENKYNQGLYCMYIGWTHTKGMYGLNNDLV